MISNFNLDYWPIVYFKSYGDSVDNDSFEEYKKYYLNLLIKCKNNNQKMILICNLNKLTSYPIEFIIKQAEFSKKIFKFNQEYVKCVCILCKNKSFKSILNLFFTFVKPSSPYKLCRSFDKIDTYLLDNFNIKFKTNIFDDSIKNNLVNENMKEDIKEDINNDINEDSNEDTNEDTNEDINEDINETEYKCESKLEEYNQQINYNI